MIRCCNAERHTRFCPECGEELISDDAIYEILKHIRSTIKGHRKTFESFLDSVKTGQYDKYDEDHVKRIQLRHERIIARWTAWEVALLDMIERTSREGFRSE